MKLGVEVENGQQSSNPELFFNLTPLTPPTTLPHTPLTHPKTLTLPILVRYGCGNTSVENYDYFWLFWRHETSLARQCHRCKLLTHWYPEQLFAKNYPVLTTYDFVLRIMLINSRFNTGNCWGRIKEGNGHECKITVQVSWALFKYSIGKLYNTHTIVRNIPVVKYVSFSHELSSVNVWVALSPPGVMAS